MSRFISLFTYSSECVYPIKSLISDPYSHVSFSEIAVQLPSKLFCLFPYVYIFLRFFRRLFSLYSLFFWLMFSAVVLFYLFALTCIYCSYPIRHRSIFLFGTLSTLVINIYLKLILLSSYKSGVEPLISLLFCF